MAHVPAAALATCSHLGGSFLLQIFGSRIVNPPYGGSLNRQTHGQTLARAVRSVTVTVTVTVTLPSDSRWIIY